MYWIYRTMWLDFNSNYNSVRNKYATKALEKKIESANKSKIFSSITVEVHWRFSSNGSINVSVYKEIYF